MWNYTVDMARGWESKSIEAQQEEAAQTKGNGKPLLTREEAQRERTLTNLRLSLRRVVEQLAISQNARHRSMLELARNDLEQKINSFETKSQPAKVVSPSDQV
jgi:hypothetical protein